MNGHNILLEADRYKFNYKPEEFKSYCREQIKSISVAIERKSRGSTVEEAYFLEHVEKLKNFFLKSKVTL